MNDVIQKIETAQEETEGKITTVVNEFSKAMRFLRKSQKRKAAVHENAVITALNKIHSKLGMETITTSEGNVGTSGGDK